MPNILILGAGVSGQATARWAIDQGFCVRVSDVKPFYAWNQGFCEWCQANSVEMEAGGHSCDGIDRFDLVVVSPGIDLKIEVLRSAQAMGIPVVGELFLAASLWQGPILAITGTNGKTTTTKLVGDMLQRMGLNPVVAGNIGCPLISLVNEDCHQVAVLEVSSFQLDTFVNEPVLGLPMPRFNAFAILNIAPDHLDRYDGFHGYAASKLRGLNFLSKGAKAVVNAGLVAMLDGFGLGHSEYMTFGLERGGESGAVIKDGLVEIYGMNGVETYDTAGWRLKGLHNLENLAAAILLVLSLYDCRQARSGIASSISAFEPPAHRLQFVAEINGVDFYDDSKATNVAAVHTALSAMDRSVVLIAGGRGKGEAYDELRDWAEKGRIRAVVTLGEEGPAIAKVFEGVCPVYEIVDMTGGLSAMEKAVRQAMEAAAQGDAVLLAPACASFDLFKGYAERGDVFQAVVNRLLAEVLHDA
ncbi:MAG: UDP-N-acetylmuramoyl-L-alanine--D-glutamate ligase [Dissulfuribacterales bacterium]